MSQDEQVDIVDEDGNFIEVVSKKVAHEKGLLHKTVIVQIVNSKGEFVLVKQSSDKQDAGKYVWPVGGHVSAGETDVEALKKEVREEAGIMEDFRYEFIGQKINNRNVLGRQENHLFVMYKIFSDQEPILNHESESFTYFTEEELKKEIKTNPNDFGINFYFVTRNFFPNFL